jgi:hypothetical protein
VVDDQYRHFREAAGQDLFQARDVFGCGVVDEDDDVSAERLQGGHGFDGGHQVGGRLERQRHDCDVGHFGRLDDAALDEATEVDDQWRSFERAADVGKRLFRLQSDNAAGGERGLVDVGGAGGEVVGDQDGARVLGVSDGVGGLPLPAFDRVEEYGHGSHRLWDSAFILLRNRAQAS